MANLFKITTTQTNINYPSNQPIIVKLPIDAVVTAYYDSNGDFLIDVEQCFGSPILGPTGPTGPTGNIGPPGLTITGKTGDTGPTGPAGPIGISNIPGPTGPTGLSGNVGPTGPIGLTGVGVTGPTGKVGPTGPQGVSNIPGPVGPTGPTGKQGNTGNIGATGPIGLVGPTGLTGNIGPQGNIGNTGPTGPAGPIGIGIVGPQGATGPQGNAITGPTGAIGNTGPTGAQGIIGATGAVGPRGYTGNIGATGPTGIQGNPGLNGATGLMGPIGATGATGPTGLQGIAGNIGPSGATGARGLVGPTGPTGLQGVAGIIGATGATGLMGPRGFDGFIGPTGAPGLSDVPGPTGPTGPKGNIGIPGIIGPTGVQGPTGPTGAQGIAGRIGPTGPGVGATGPTGSPGVTGPIGPTGTMGPTGATGNTGNTGNTGVAAPSAITKTKTVFIGGTGQKFYTLADPVANAKLLAAGNIGLYMHGNGMAALTVAQREALWQTWSITGVTATGQGQAVGEVGGFSPVDAVYLSYFGGAYPNTVNMNIITGSGDGSGTYTASTANGDAIPNKQYTGYITASDLSTMQTAVQAANVAGAKNVAIFLTPNGGGEDLDDPFATAAFWANARAIALYCGAMAFDIPPSYWQARGATYQNFINQMVAWGNKHNIRTCITVSPYATVADSAGNIGGSGYDNNFLANTEALVASLHGYGAYPSQWVVENYNPGGTENDVATDETPGSLNQIALYLATLPTVMQGTLPAQSNNICDYGLLGNASTYGDMISTLNYVPVQQGTGFGQLTNNIKIGWNGSNLKATVDVTDLGNFAMQSWVTSNYASINNPPQFIGLISSNIGLSIGSQASPANTAYLDFHSSGNAGYDTRLIATGGSATVGQGNLTFMGNTLLIPNNIQVSGIVAAVTANIGTLNVLTSTNITGTANISVAIELGNETASSTPYLDFHSSGNADYDTRLIATGGNATVGQGNLTFMGSSLLIPNNIQVSGIAAIAIGNINNLNVATTAEINCTLNVNNSANILTAIELGNQAAANTPYIDFHSSGGNIDYDARIIATAGNGTVGHGTLSFVANINYLEGNILMSGLAASTSYANDSAASTGGVAINQLYRNGSQVCIRVT